MAEHEVPIYKLQSR